jgi:hypothetical protein
MACVLTSGRNEPCKDAVGGLKSAIFLDFIEDSFTVTAGECTAINGSITDVYEYDLLSDNNNIEEAFTGDQNNGTSLYSQTINLALKKQGKASANELALIVKARPVVAVKDRVGTYRVYGISDGMAASGTIVSGGAKGDFNGYNITLTATEIAPAPTIDSSTVTALEALISATVITP